MSKDLAGKGPYRAKAWGNRPIAIKEAVPTVAWAVGPTPDKELQNGTNVNSFTPHGDP